MDDSSVLLDDPPGYSWSEIGSSAKNRGSLAHPVRITVVLMVRACGRKLPILAIVKRNTVFVMSMAARCAEKYQSPVMIDITAYGKRQ